MSKIDWYEEDKMHAIPNSWRALYREWLHVETLVMSAQTEDDHAVAQYMIDDVREELDEPGVEDFDLWRSFMDLHTKFERAIEQWRICERERA